ncbi:ATP-dependent helicase DinG [Oceanobacillus piezotolerans]|uniref:3'-5' exonuclease DinG n=1 Tax=Oceanobacillus piezotolerans TaxID=2448030 RepID=A0A498DGB2_9BACI|nr:ATP-dependent DNA helicase DinG [Oceanobacillus piezotolerans]RLL48228.1 ATP-dependent helicase DinG [Oceanobacillus piezotolerans]
MDKFVVIDLETTGHSPAKDDKIIEIGIVVIENNQITDTKTTFFNPDQSIPPFISNLTGITDADVKNAPFFHEKADNIVHIFEDSYLIAHNVPFDLGFLNAELEKNGRSKLTNPVIDTVELSRILYPEAPSYKLGQLAEFLDIRHDDPHRALSDAYVTAKLFLKLLKKLHSLPYETVNGMLELENMLHSDLYELLYERQQALAFSNDEENIESFQGLAFRRIDVEKTEKESLDESFGTLLDDIYEENGVLSQHIPNYEKRSGQREMSEVIFDAFHGHSHALIEAETGTGKSLAYLIPAIYDAVKTKQRIVISTYTTQLQSQLIDHEIPLIEKLFPFSFRVAILKGKNHYISLEKFAHELFYPSENNYDIALTKAMLLVWLTETVTGDIEELNLPSSGFMFFKKISTEAEGMMDPQSPWFSKSYYQKARKKAMQADIIITNHALLCTDMFNDYSFIPNYKRAIIDEAHHFEDTAAHHYGLKLDYNHIQYLLNHIGHKEEGKMFGKLIARFSEFHDQLPIDNWDNILDELKFEVEELFRSLYEFVANKRSNSNSISDIGRLQCRLDELEQEEVWNFLEERVTRITFFIRDLIHILAMIEQVLELNEALDKFDKDDMNGMTVVLQDLIDGFEQLFLVEDVIPQVKWVEADTKGSRNAVYLYSEPTDVSTLLGSTFFEQKESVVLTSATLTMDKSFNFIQERLGISSERLFTKKIDSPFSYENQVQLMIPNDFPDIKFGKMDDYIYATCEAILSLADITDGRMLVLFTSYDMLKKSYNLLKETMDLDQYVLIGQGITSGSRARLKKNFQTFEKAILLGTSSFWEGVDIPGEDLSCLVIVRLPFQPPKHPVYEAKARHLEEQGKNAFMEYSLPNAVIKFKQGFGRLIRANNDRGIVFVCDARIKKTRYGRYFTSSIPAVPITYDSTVRIMEKAKQWF